MPTRRQFLRRMGAVAAVCGCGEHELRAAERAAGPTDWPIAVFEKVFEALSYDELADAMAAIGVEGVEATIRPKGHIEPEAAGDEVPRMAEAMAKRGKRIVIAATHISAADEPHTVPLLQTLKAAGVTHYRMGHYYYDLAKPLKAQLDRCAAHVRELAALNLQVGIQGLYQNHSSSGRARGYVGALGWDAVMLLDGVDPHAIGLAVDTRHLRQDTGSSWRTAVMACKPHIRSIYVKDGLWHGPRGDQYKDVPLDTGFVNQDVFHYIR
ncbi:MAG: TIM barrel protein, partial [Planctomycetes bacterium]|nr:TIM barrel protein [Planctomycetota bacterium]